MKRLLLTRWDMIFVAIVSSGVVTPVLALTGKASGWMLVIDAVLSAGLGLLIALIVATAVRFVEHRLKGR
jgi:uncharacterized membrane protein